MGPKRARANTASEQRTAGPGPQRGLFVGIGASAGALEALERFFAHVPHESGLAFVVVQHLERHHPSVLAELLGKHTQMPVEQAEEGTRARPNHVYVIPPNSVLTLERGVLRIARPAETGLRAPVDAFFRSLARDQGETAAGIILSGTGTDGTSGLRAIKEHGGLTLAQAPETARYESMPESAIAAGLVDAVLPVEEMPARLLAYARHLGEIQRGEAEHLDAEIAARLHAICAILLRHTGHDFSRYKEGTLVRRIGRRVRIQDAASVGDYTQRLERDAGEAESLVRDLSIGVTHFFRDAEIFEALAKTCLPAILDGGDPSTPVRIWVPGCASGEEAYSIAILAREHLARRQTTRTVQIFATDIDSELVATARHGRYSGEIRQHVSAERLESFFAQEKGSQETTFQVVKELRDMCTFSVHSLIKDPPFSSLDLISCRNVFIYLGADLQKKLVPLFHFALRSGGYLLLGPSEDLAAHDELFARVDRQHRLFRRKDAAVRPPELPLVGRLVSRGTPHVLSPKPEPLVQPPMLSQSLERMIREDYAPPCVVVNERGDVLYLAGKTSRYLQAREGAPTNNILDQARTGLRLELRTALGTAVKTRRAVVRRDVPVEAIEAGGEVRHVCLTVRPLPGLPTDAGLFAVVLQETEAASDLEGAVDVEGAPEPEREQLIIEQLEDELRTTRADLQSSAEELETSNEELKSANEELISANEELQSTNEELQSSREELQTVNDELREKVQALDVAQSDLQSHYASSKIATIFLDRGLRITRFTPAAMALFRLIEGDVGRPIGDLALRVRHEGLLADAQAVLRTEQSVERHVRAAEGEQWFLVRVLPHRAQGGAVAGVGLTFVDVTGLMRSEEAERRYGQLLMLSPDAVFVWRLDDGIETWNRGAQELYGFSLEEARGRVPRELLHTVLPRPFSEIEAALREHGRWEGDLVHQAKDGRSITASAKLQVVRGDDEVERVLETNRDITARKRTEEDLRESQAVLQEADRRKNEFLAVLSHELRNPLAPIRNSLYILDRAAPGGEQAKRAKLVIDRQVGQLARLVDDILDVTRITRGKVLLQRSRVELADLLRRTAEDHRSVFVASGLKLEVRVDTGPIWLNGDPVRLAQAVGNLLQNAAKFTARGGHVLLALGEDVPRRTAVIRVHDDGMGITPDVLQQIFQPFQQADRTLDRSRGGLGLGLALVKGLVELHGGEVSGHSEGTGKGAEFTIRLPLEETAHAAQTVAVETPVRVPRRVLVIEDNVDAANSLREALELGEHTVGVAYDGPEGLEKARELQPEVVLCDIGLPGMDGYEVARAFRADAKLCSVRLVALTGYALPEDLAKAKEAGFDEHLAKPPSIEALEEVMASTSPR